MKPILFNTDMVREIMAGRKTQTRRPIKEQPEEGYHPIGWVLESTEPKHVGCFGWGNEPQIPGIMHHAKPPYQKGDILYVRETFQESEYFDYSIKDEYYYKADPEIEEYAEEYGVSWKPSIHMPKEAARTFLKVTDVRIERLQDMWNKDAIAEGFRGDDTFNAQYYFCVTWDGIYKSKGYGWSQNPWVWAIEFERYDKPEAEGK